MEFVKPFQISVVPSYLGRHIVCVSPGAIHNEKVGKYKNRDEDAFMIVDAQYANTIGMLLLPFGKVVIMVLKQPGPFDSDWLVCITQDELESEFEVETLFAIATISVVGVRCKKQNGGTLSS
jgi:hypothetical protein